MFIRTLGDFVASNAKNLQNGGSFPVIALSNNPRL